jgi:Icc-related predicted phosphoesterase
MPNRTETTNQAENGKRALCLVCIGDTHGHHRKLKLPVGDILIHSGDFMVDGSSVEEIDDFNLWLGSLPFRHKLVIAGNHDRLFDDDPKLARAHLTNATYLQDSGVTLEGLKFWGSPVNSVGGDWAFSRDRTVKIRKHWDRIPDDTDVLITHEPPFGTLDKSHILAKHRGCQYLLGAVRRVQPKLHVFGHVHGSYGQEVAWGGVILVNCAVVDNERVLANPPTVVKLDL